MLLEGNLEISINGLKMFISFHLVILLLGIHPEKTTREEPFCFLHHK